MAASEIGWSNWSGGVTSRGAVAHPASEAELADALRKATGPVRPAGTGHSFTPLCGSPGMVVKLDNMTGLIAADREAMSAELWAGTPVYAVGPLLHPHGIALSNQGDIDRQTLGGAIGTGTHGTGTQLGSLSTMVGGVTLVTSSGDILSADVNSDPDLYQSARLSLGALGVITRFRLNLVSSFALNEMSYAAPATDILPTIAALGAAHRHFEFFWFPYADQLIVKTLDAAQASPARVLSVADMLARGERRSREDKLFEMICKTVRRLPPSSKYFHRLLTRQMASTEARPGRVRWSWETFPSARNTRFNEMEYAVPAERGAEAIKAVVDRVRKERIPTAFPFEFRFVKGDDVWLSPFYGRDSATISVHQYATMDQSRLFKACEEVFRSFGGRPHWGKQHSLGAKEFASIYPKWEDFQAVRRRVDPDGKMLSSYLREIMVDGAANPGRIR